MKPPVVSTSIEVMGGTEVFAGTRVPTQTLVDFLVAGDSVDDFLEGYPPVSREQALEFLRTTNVQKTERNLGTSSYLPLFGYLASGILGLILTFYVPDFFPDATILPFLMLGGFFISFFSMAGLLAFMVRSLRPLTTNQDLVEWELDRSDGRQKYLKKFFIKWAFTALPIIGILSLPSIMNDDLPFGRIVFLTFLVAITLLSILGIGRRLWKHHEQEHSLALENSAQKLDKTFDS